VVGLDITSGLPRVEELFEARTPRGQALISEIDGTAEVVQNEEGRKIKVVSEEVYHDEYSLPTGWQVMIKNKQWVDIGTVLAAPAKKKGAKKEEAQPETEIEPILARFAGEVSVKKKQLVISYVEKEEREYPVPSTASIWVVDGAQVKAGQQLTDGSINPHDILRILGKEAVQQYLVDEVQKVYRSQGVNINDKHIEVVVHQMLTKVRIDSAGDTDLVPDELVDKFTYEDTNAKVLAEGGEPATAHTVLLGITRASLSTDSWLAAASFQETTRILTEAAANGRVDKLIGLKENVIIGKLIPARYLKEEEVAELMPGEEDEALRLLANLAGEETAEATGMETEEPPGEAADLLGSDASDTEAPDVEKSDVAQPEMEVPDVEMPDNETPDMETTEIKLADIDTGKEAADEEAEEKEPD
jgi:DNA-directed RNA polymerase subunit beta'